jgi:two-component system response regulator MprA
MTENAKAAKAILLVEDDDEIREAMTEFLHVRGYRVIEATNEADSIEEILKSGYRIGLILVDQDLNSDDALAIGRRLRDHFKMGEGVPVVVLPVEFKKEMEGTDEDVGGLDCKSYLANGQQLEGLLSRLLPRDGEI